MPAAHASFGVLVDFLCGGWGAESEPRKNRGCPSEISVLLPYTFILSIRLTFLYDIPQCLTVVGIFCDRFAKVPRLACPIIHSQGKMVGSYCASHCWAARFDSFYGCPCRCMLEHNAQFGECGVQLEEIWQEGRLCVEDMDILRNSIY